MESNRKREETDGTGQNDIKRQQTHQSHQGFSVQQMLITKSETCFVIIVGNVLDKYLF